VRVTAFLATLALSACLQQPPVTTEADAISAADRACYESWGKFLERTAGSKWTVQPPWHARLEGDHWKAWSGDPNNPALSINIPRDGTRPDPNTCDLRFQD
jgi:hypothetical protein